MMTPIYLFILLVVLSSCNGGTLPLSYLRSRVGLNTHMTWDVNAYANVNVVTQGLIGMGAGMIREASVPASDTRHWNEIKTLYQNGYRFNLIVLTDQTVTEFITQAAAMETAMPGLIFSIELPNEMNTPCYGQPNGQNGFTYHGKNSTFDPSVFAAVAVDYYAAIKANPVLKNFAVLCPTVSIGYAGWQDYLVRAKAFAGGRKMCDWANMHPYGYGDGQALPSIQYQLGVVANVEAPGSPWAISEIGWTGYTTDQRKAVGKYILNAIFDTFYQGGQFVLFYDAFRDTSIPNDQGGEPNYGIMDFNGAMLPSGQVLKNFLAIVRDTRTPVTLTNMAISFSGVANVKSLQFQHSNTHLFIMVSSEIPFWNGAWINQAARPLTVNLPAGVAILNVYDPYVSASPIASPMAVIPSYTVNSFSDHPILLEVSTVACPANSLGAAMFEYGYLDSTSNRPLVSPDCRFRLYMQEDGNAVIYTNTNAVVWASDTHPGSSTAPFYLRLQTDGNLVIYDKNAHGIWSSNTVKVGSSPYHLVMQNDGNLVLTYGTSWAPIWASNTATY